MHYSAIVYAAVILVVGELFIVDRTTKLPAIFVPPSSGTHADTCGAIFALSIRGLRRFFSRAAKVMGLRRNREAPYRQTVPIEDV